MATLVRLAGALHAHLQATMGNQSKGLSEAELLTIIASVACQFNVAATPETGDRETTKAPSVRGEAERAVIPFV